MEWFLKASALGISAYLAFCAMIYFMQPGMIFYPNMPDRKLVTTPANIGLEYYDVDLTTKDNIKLHGWFIAGSKTHKPKHTLLFFHGNAGNISHRLDSIKLFHQLGLNVFIIDYRGYGQSAGKISEKGMYHDAEAAWLYLTEQQNIKPENIIIFGRSLGGAIAAWLASQHTPAALIIESSFSSVESMGKRFYPFLPVKLISRFHFNTEEYTREVQCPVLITHSRNDEIIPYEESQKIYNSATEPKQFLHMQGGHNDGFLVSGQNYIQGLQSFISDLNNHH